MNWNDAGWAYWNEERIESTEPDLPPFDNYKRFAGIWIARAEKVIAAAIGDKVVVSPDDLRELKDWAEVCDHIDHHGYCQTHGLGDTDGDGLCGIGRLIVSVDEAER